MGYSDSWLTHGGGLTAHNEVALHVFDRMPLTAVSPIESVLVIGVANNGSLEIWRDVLGEDASVIGLDWDPRCGEYPDVFVGDMSEGWLREVLRKRWFDLIIDSTGFTLPLVWPFLRFNGRGVLEHFQTEMLDELLASLREDRNDTWLPVEEVMSVQVYPTVAVIEKRSPRVVPYQDVMSGVLSSVQSEEMLSRMGFLRVANIV